MIVRKIGLSLLGIVLVLSLVGCNGGVQRFVAGNANGSVDTDKLVREIRSQVAHVTVQQVRNGDLAVSTREIDLNGLARQVQLLEELRLEPSQFLPSQARNVVGNIGKAKGKPFQAQEVREVSSFNDGYRLTVELKNRKTFKVDINSKGDILVVADRGERYLFSGGRRVYEFFSGIREDDFIQPSKGIFSSLDKANAVKIIYKQENQGDLVIENSPDVLQWSVRSLQAMSLEKTSIQVAFNVNRPHFEFQFSSGSIRERVRIQGNYLWYGTQLFTMENNSLTCYQWMERSWERFENSGGLDRWGFDRLYNAATVDMLYVSQGMVEGRYTNNQFPGLKNWIIETVKDLPLKKMEGQPVFIALYQPHFEATFRMKEQNITLKVWGPFVQYGDQYFVTTNNEPAFEWMEEAWKEFAPPWYNDSKTGLAHLGRADEVTVHYNNNIYTGEGIRNWAVHSLLSLPLQEGDAPVIRTQNQFTIECTVQGERFEINIYDNSLVVRCLDRSNQVVKYYVGKDTGENSLIKLMGKSWDDYHRLQDLNRLFHATAVEMEYQQVGKKGELYSSSQLEYLTPWTVHSLLTLDLDNANVTISDYTNSSYFSFEFVVNGEKERVIVVGSYVQYQGNGYKMRNNSNAFTMLENRWFDACR